jgi:glycosyltransferase involved in cell wall biosynthesis
MQKQKKQDENFVKPQKTSQQTLSIIVPCYNEEKTIERVLDTVLRVQLPLKKEIVVVDDCSKDNSYKILLSYAKKHPQVSVLHHQKNQGKGAALRTGIQKATGDFIIIQDADLEYDPNEYTLLLRPILEGHADVVYGSRFMGGKPHRILFFFHSIGNKLLTFLSNMTTNLNLTDMETCYKLFRAEHLKKIKLTENRFGFEPEVTAKISRIPHIRIYEVGISYYGRTYAEGKKINWKDGVRAIYVILKYGVFKRR